MIVCRVVAYGSSASNLHVASQSTQRESLFYDSVCVKFIVFFSKSSNVNYKTNDSGLDILPWLRYQTGQTYIFKHLIREILFLPVYMFSFS